MNDQSTLTAEVKRLAKALGAELVGIASVERLDRIHPLIEAIFGEERIVVAENRPDKTIVGSPDHAFTATGMERIAITRAQDYLPDAKSVIVLGITIPSRWSRAWPSHRRRTSGRTGAS